MLAIVGATACTHPTAAEGDDSGIVTLTGGNSTVSGGDAGETAPPDGECESDLDCGGDRKCWYRECTEPDDLPTCLQLVPGACGDGVIQAPEECDGGSGCDRCSAASGPQPWVVAEELVGFAPTADGEGLALERDVLTRYGLDGAAAWTQTFANLGAGVAVDAAGNAYVVGDSPLFGGFDRAPWIASWDAQGMQRWSIDGSSHGSFSTVAVDDTGVVAGGRTEQVNSKSDRGLLARYAGDGTALWSVAIPSLFGVGDVAIAGTDIAVVGWGIAPQTARMLVRLDADGVERWSLALAPTKAGEDGPDGVAHDGSGGTWIFGQRGGGPWAVRHDADGNEVERLDCIGSAPGAVKHLRVGPAGQIGLAIHIHLDPVPTGTPAPWFAIVEGGAVTRAFIPDPEGDDTDRTFSVGWRDDGKLLAGWFEIVASLYVYHIVVLEPGA